MIHVKADNGQLLSIRLFIYMGGEFNCNVYPNFEYTIKP